MLTSIHSGKFYNIVTFVGGDVWYAYIFQEAFFRTINNWGMILLVLKVVQVNALLI